MAVQVRPLICQRPRQWTATHYGQVLLVHGRPDYPHPLRPLLQQHHHFLRRQLPLPPGHQGLEHHGRRRRRPGKAGHPVGRGGRRHQPHWVWPYPLWPPLLVAAAGRQETQPLRPHPECDQPCRSAPDWHPDQECDQELLLPVGHQLLCHGPEWEIDGDGHYHRLSEDPGQQRLQQYLDCVGVQVLPKKKQEHGRGAVPVDEQVNCGQQTV